ncbi:MULTISPECIES: hypothetical protein [unclassified Flavobacterium]|uniref:hypothetical protein n=1 Tax=unclassified Flavobacterium TaxID=196869 RepID=UPI00131D20AA|nr:MULTISPECIES: hypothetical protein [unclassified Flavobacterium]
MSNKKKMLLLFLFLFVESICNAQEFRLQIIGNSKEETKIIDSLNYQTKHKNINSIKEEIQKFLKKTSSLGYIEAKQLPLNKVNDSTFTNRIELGQQTTRILITIEDQETIALLKLKKSTIEIPYAEVENFLNQTLDLLDDKGYIFATLKLNTIKSEKSILNTELHIQKNAFRSINAIVIKQTEKKKFPKGHLTQINRKYKNKLFNLKILEKINADFNQLSFANQTKYPEFLATTDTTKVYVYLEKKNSNTFDGFVGFNNNENRFTLNGFLDLQLENILNKGEQIQIFWKSDGNDQKTFKASFSLPYLFNSPIGIQSDLQIFRQDTTFQNTKTTLGLNYILKNNSKINLEYKSTQSSKIENININIEGFNNNFITVGYDNNHLLSSNRKIKTQLTTSTTIGAGNRLINIESKKPTQQFQIDLKNKLTFEFNNKHSIHINNQNYYLSSKEYVENELNRFGGFKSVRGFRENSIMTYLFTTFMTEYRFALTPKLYIHSIVDLAYYETKLQNTLKSNNLTGIGFGLATQTRNGLLHIAIASGTEYTQKNKTKNTILHVSYNIKF